MIIVAAIRRNGDDKIKRNQKPKKSIPRKTEQ